MFDFDAGKILVFGIVALAVIPPKDLPRVLRTVGKYVGQMRRMAADFQGQFMEAMKEAELESVRKELADMKAAATTSFDPAVIARDHIEKAVEAPVTPTSYETVTVAEPAPAAAIPPPALEDQAAEAQAASHPT